MNKTYTDRPTYTDERGIRYFSSLNGSRVNYPTGTRFSDGYAQPEIGKERFMMTFKEAKKQCHKVGTAHATGDALRSMYAELIVVTHPGLNPYSAEKFYIHLQRYETDADITNRSRELLRNGLDAADVLWT